MALEHSHAHFESVRQQFSDVGIEIFAYTRGRLRLSDLPVSTCSQKSATVPKTKPLACARGSVATSEPRPSGSDLRELR